MNEDTDKLNLLRNTVEMLEQRLMTTRAAIAEVEARLKWSYSKQAENDTEFLLAHPPRHTPPRQPDILP